jgi:hypothetical protein
LKRQVFQKERRNRGINWKKKIEFILSLYPGTWSVSFKPNQLTRKEKNKEENTKIFLFLKSRKQYTYVYILEGVIRYLNTIMINK